VIDVNFFSSPEHIEIKGGAKVKDNWRELLILLKSWQSFVNKGVSEYSGISMSNVKTQCALYQRDGSGRISIALTKG
jgi:hypothetical protein